jgi:uncharacterized membrane protein (UPF0127 family)
MVSMRVMGPALAAAALLMAAACGNSAGAQAPAAAAMPKLQVTITSSNGQHRFDVELARTDAEQERGLMYRTNIPADGGMLFAPYPAEGGGPKEASFWMEHTPSALDIIFIRPDGTIARIARNAVPFSQDRILSGEPVNAVLEINGGRSAELGISVGDKVSWPH